MLGRQNSKLSWRSWAHVFAKAWFHFLPFFSWSLSRQNVARQSIISHWLHVALVCLASVYHKFSYFVVGTIATFTYSLQIFFAGEGASTFLNFVKGDLILLDEDTTGEAVLTSGWCAGTCERTEERGDFPAEAVYVLPCLNRPPDDILVNFLNFMAGNTAHITFLIMPFMYNFGQKSVFGHFKLVCGTVFSPSKSLTHAWWCFCVFGTIFLAYIPTK